MIEIREVKESKLKIDIADKVLRALPEWFGIERIISIYTSSSAELPFWAVFDNGEPVGFLALKPHNQLHVELYVMGILRQYHRSSIGRGLFNSIQNHCIKNDFRYLSVKTLDYSSDDENYVKTRKFYKAMGFQPFEVLEGLWDKDNPCLVMIKDLKDANNSYKCRSKEQ